MSALVKCSNPATVLSHTLCLQVCIRLWPSCAAYLPPLTEARSMCPMYLSCLLAALPCALFAFALQFSTAAAWATREDRLRETQMALMGTLADDNSKQRKATPEPDKSAAAAAAGKDEQQREQRQSESGGAAMSGSREQQHAGASEDADAFAADVDGGGTPMHPASEGEDMDIDEEDRPGRTAAAAAARVGSTNAAAARMGDTQAMLQLQRSEQLSSLAGPAAAAAAADGGGGGGGGGLATPTASSSLAVPAGSAAGAGAHALQQVASVTSKTTGGFFAGFDWAAVKSEALRAVPTEQQQAAAKQQAAAAAGADNPASGTADEAPYNPDDDDDEEQPYDPTESGSGLPAPSAAAPPAAAGTGSAAALAAAAAAAAPVDPALPDLLPVVAGRNRRSGPGPVPGDAVWNGIFCVPGSGGGSFSADVRHVGGMSDVGSMLVAPGSAVEVIGRVALDKFAAFAEELRKSRSRTISLGVVGVSPNAAPMDAAYMHELLRGYSSKGRIGKLGLPKDIEGYLVAKSGEWGWFVRRCTVKYAAAAYVCIGMRDAGVFSSMLVQRPCGNLTCSVQNPSMICNLDSKLARTVQAEKTA
jgi:hypothetical protein